MPIVEKQRITYPVEVVEWTGTNLSNVFEMLGVDVVRYEFGDLYVNNVFVPVSDNIVATPHTEYVPFSPFIPGDPEAEPEPIPDTPEVEEVPFAPGLFIEVVTDAVLAAKYEDIP